ncbi:hypothetical protein [uncultured Desulfovibrio sp.]|uniref:hypothetical protein n=1 Tax=uncultured Desulfovibrio sp. TaxID=167968 RepID=UPI002622B01A|nr:hypothetical protein [uncultured Desulfovibrio sp.]
MRRTFHERAADVRLGRDAALDAWMYGLMVDNNIAYPLNPAIIAGPEQLAFMVWLEEGQVYLPCSDSVFRQLQSRDKTALRAQYLEIWQQTRKMVCRVAARHVRRLLLQFCRLRYRQAVAAGTILPTRLAKRMATSVLTFDDPWGDPWQEGRRAAHARQRRLLQLPALQAALDYLPPQTDTAETSRSLQAEGRRLSRHALARRLALALAGSELAEACCGEGAAGDLPEAAREAHFQELFARAEQELASACRCLLEVAARGGTVLLLCDREGGTVHDLELARFCTGLGLRVIYAVKSACHDNAPTLDDLEGDPALTECVSRDGILHDERISKNALLRHLRAHRLTIMGDGTGEALNLYRVSVSFSRAWKEADLVLAKGRTSADILLGTSHAFTRDILCFWRDGEGMHGVFRPHSPHALKFNERDIARQADAIIEEMRAARRAGKNVMFYSCIIGSIPGQTHTAIELVTAFIDKLRRQMDNTFIINPAEHFVAGMDGDDLMFMWERVQRSGCIDIWRFQTVEDIEESFALLGRKVPAVWTGKDATYSTGCTKEMRIALEMQAVNREMQIIGPEARMFMRRGEYGVGKYFDAALGRTQHEQ